jgi:hypothetical protein
MQSEGAICRDNRERREDTGSAIEGSPMKRSSGPRKTASNLSESVHQQLSVYAVAAVVAVVSVLALTQPSEAKIVYTPANVVLSCPHARRDANIVGIVGGCNQQYNLDLNHDGVTDFTIAVHTEDSGICNIGASADELPASGNGAIGSGGYAAALMQGAPIGHSQQFQGSRRTMAFDGVEPDCREIHGGPWFNVTDGYLGLSFRRNGRTHYGWARLNVYVSAKEGFSQATLTGYAYETIAGKSIIAGQTKGAADDSTNDDFGPGASLTSPVPDKPASLGMLALGAQGVPIWRRKESVLQGN